MHTSTHCPVAVLQVGVGSAQLPQVPPQPSGPQTRPPVQSAVQVHLLLASQVFGVTQGPHSFTAPQSSVNVPHSQPLVAQVMVGVQTTHRLLTQASVPPQVAQVWVVPQLSTKLPHSYWWLRHVSVGWQIPHFLVAVLQTGFGAAQVPQGFTVPQLSVKLSHS